MKNILNENKSVYIYIYDKVKESSRKRKKSVNGIHSLV